MGTSKGSRGTPRDERDASSSDQGGTEGVLTWSLTYAGQTWTDFDVKVAHAMLVAELLGSDDWSATTPVSGPKSLAAWLAVLLAAATGKPLMDVMVAVQAMPLHELRDCLKV